MAIVKNAHLKKQKGAGKGSGKDRLPRKCHECDSPDHIATNCLQRAARVAAGGPERLDDPMGLAGGKAKGKAGGKKGKGNKGGGKGGKGGVWTTAGDHGGFWVPTRAQIKGSGGFPFPSQHQYAHPWHTEGKGGQPSANLMIGNGCDDSEWSGWFSATGQAMSFRQVPTQAAVQLPPRAAVKTSNTFAVLETEEPDIPDPPEPPESAQQRSHRYPVHRHLPALSGAPRRCCGLTSSQCRFQSASAAEVPQDSVMAHAKAVTLSHDHKTTVDGLHKTTVDGRKRSAKTFQEKRAQSLKPMASGWETLTMILDSGASVSVVPPSVGGEYDIVCGRAAMAGVKYEIADGSQIPNLGEKLLPIVHVKTRGVASRLKSQTSLKRSSRFGAL